MENSSESVIAEKATVVYLEEKKINPSLALYLITWCPDPGNSPDAAFDIEHEHSIDIIADYLENCACGLFCVEATQRGSPHYHGWYQVDPLKELKRVCIMKVLIRYGQVKITAVKHERCIKINKWYEKGNALYYYKKDLLEAQLETQNNPITAQSCTMIDWNNLEYQNFFTRGIDKGIAKLLTKVQSDKQFFRQFYSSNNVRKEHTTSMRAERKVQGANPTFTLPEK